MKIFTIGFTHKKAERFFEMLRQAEVKRIVDVRLNNVSQLAGFTKREDLRYFLRAVCGIDYVHIVDLAPTRELLDAYQKQKGDWAAYEKGFLDLMRRRRVESTLVKEVIDQGCLLCSEDKPHYCHRRLVAEYLQRRWSAVTIEHLT